MCLENYLLIIEKELLGGKNMNIQKVHNHIDKMKEKDLNLFKRLVAQPSISAQNIGIRECAELLKEIMGKIGIKATIYETSGHPIVFAEIKAINPNAQTILFYGHYDVQPPEPLNEWKTPPFEPTIINGRLYGRGTADNKGQFLAHILSVRSYIEANNGVPVNVKFVLDGEEEISSPSMKGFVEEHRDVLDADLVYNSDGPVQASGAPEIKHGFRGLLSFELNLETAAHENHSGRAGGLIPNAAIEMVRLLSTMIDDNNRVTIEGFYDDVMPPTDHELKLIDKIPFNPEGLAKVYGIKDLNLNKKQYYEKMMFKPTFTINGISSGYTGKGSKSCVPGSAMVKIDMRLVDNQDPTDIEEKIKKHIAKYNLNVKMVNIEKVSPSKTPIDLAICKAVVESTRKYYENAVAVPTSGGTNPDFVWTKILKTASVTVPYGNADQANHAANENMALDYFYKGIHVSAQVIDTIAKLKK